MSVACSEPPSRWVTTGRPRRPVPVSGRVSRHEREGAQPGELGDVRRGELLEGGHAEQAHRAGDLFRQDLDRPVDALAAAGHQPVSAD